MLAFDNTEVGLRRPGFGPFFDGLSLSLVPFDPQQLDYNPRNAWWLADLSRLVYRSSATDGAVHSDRPTLLQKAGLKETNVIANSPEGTHAAIISAPTFHVLVFRGTGETTDWLTNLKFDHEKWPHGKGRVHSGFKKALDVVWDPIAKAIAPLRGPLFITGHSLGGALATLAGARLGRDGVARATYAFGAPRVGNAEFAQNYPANMRLYRVVNDNDAVTVVPPASFGYKHAGQPRTITEDGRLVIGKASDNLALTRRLLRLIPLLHARDIPLPDCLTDHSPVNYVAWLQRLAAGR